MQYSPKLKMAMEEIKETLRKHDVAALIVLHKPGFGEYYFKVDTTYSCARLDEKTGLMRIKAKAAELPGGAAQREQLLADTANMFKILCDVGYDTLEMIENVSKVVDKVVDADHDRGSGSSHTAQNN